MSSERTRSKDMLLICKGWYNHDKYNNDVFEALRAYQEKVTGVELKDISDASVLSFLISSTGIFLDKDVFNHILILDMVRDINMASTGLLPNIYPDKEIILTHKYICSKIISRLMTVDLVDTKDGYVYVDISEYSDHEEII